MPLWRDRFNWPIRRIQKAHWLTLLIISAILPFSAAATIFGTDDRVDLFEAPNGDYARLADSVVSLFTADRVIVAGGTGRLSLTKYSDLYAETGVPMCATEKFRNQSRGAYCSGSLVAPDTIMTASHCINGIPGKMDGIPCASIRFIFGFAVKKEGQYPDSVPASEIYSCARVIVSRDKNNGADFALIKLDRPVRGHTPLEINRGASVVPGAGVFLISYPMGLPLKIGLGKVRRRDAWNSVFVTDLDTSKGSSGGPIFNVATGKVEGILVRGSINDSDYTHESGCVGSVVIAQDAGGGSVATDISVIRPFIPESAAKKPDETGILYPSMAGDMKMKSAIFDKLMSGQALPFD